MLAISCLVASLLLIFLPSEPPRLFLRNLGEADSLILQELAMFNIPDHRIRSVDYPINEHFNRTHYIVDLPVQVSQTHFHAELNRQLHPYKVRTMGYVNVPEYEMTLHLVYHDKIIRTLDLRTDFDYIRTPHPARLLIYFDRIPTVSQLERISNLEISVGVVLRSTSARTLVRWVEMIPEDMHPVYLWYDDDRRSYQTTTMDDPDLRQTVDAVSREFDSIRLLVFTPDGSGSDEGLMQKFQEAGIHTVDASDMNINSSENRFEFDRQMLTYSRLARQAAGPSLMVKGTDTTLNWLEEWIPRIQRGGIVFITP